MTKGREGWQPGDTGHGDESRPTWDGAAQLTVSSRHTEPAHNRGPELFISGIFRVPFPGVAEHRTLGLESEAVGRGPRGSAPRQTDPWEAAIWYADLPSPAAW